MPPELDLFSMNRASVTAPAGCGKTQLVADTLALHRGPKPILVLTHTNAGVAALQARLARARVPRSAYRLTTIDGFAMQLVGTFPLRSRLNPEILKLDSPRTDYNAIRDATWRMLQDGHLSEVLAASYSRLIVDEYQDCLLNQHAIVDWAAVVLPTCVLGDPMQAIFNFGGNVLVDWNINVLAQFPSIGELGTPWRWINTGTADLGRWLLGSRQILAGGGNIDLHTAPPEVKWIELNAATSDAQRAAAAQTQAHSRDGTVLVIGDSRNTNGRRQMASRTPGAVIVEPADLRDLTDFGGRFAVAEPNAIAQLVGFAAELMSNVGSAEMQRRVTSLQAGTARTPPTPAEHALVLFANTPTLKTALSALVQIREQANVRVYRPDILRSCMYAMEAASDGSCTFQQATERERERCRHLGRGTARRAVGSTLLLKGLESDTAVVLYPELMDAKHLYVALTRGARAVVVCSAGRTLVPAR